MTQDPPDQNGDQGLSGANGPQNTSPISVSAIVKVRNMHHSFQPSVIVNLYNLKWLVKIMHVDDVLIHNSQRHQTRTAIRNPKM